MSSYEFRLSIGRVGALYAVFLGDGMRVGPTFDTRGEAEATIPLVTRALAAAIATAVEWGQG